MNNEAIEISKSGLQNGNPLSLLLFAWMINPEKLKNAFSKFVELNDVEDLIGLSEAIKQKQDMSGKLRDANNNPLMFNGVEILKSLSDYNEQDRERAKSLIYVA